LFPRKTNQFRQTSLIDNSLGILPDSSPPKNSSKSELQARSKRCVQFRREICPTGVARQVRP
jgi:hypothetical protein